MKTDKCFDRLPLYQYKNQFIFTEPEKFFTFPSTHLHNTKTSTANFSLDNNETMSSFMTQFSDTTQQTVVKNTQQKTLSTLHKILQSFPILCKIDLVLLKFNIQTNRQVNMTKRKLNHSIELSIGG